MFALIINAAGRITAAGSGSEDFTGTASARGTLFLDLIAAAFRPACSAAVDSARSGSAGVVEFRAAHRPATMWRATMAPFEDHTGAVSVAAIVMQRPLAALQKDELVVRAVRAIAHDLNNALTVIVGMNGLMATGSVGPRAATYIAEIGTAANKASQLTAELLAFGRRNDAETPRVFGINALLLEVEGAVRRLLPPALGLSVVTSDRSQPVRMNRSIVESMLLDLVVAVVRAMPDGGQLTLRTYASDGYTVLETSAEGASAAEMTIPASVRSAAVDWNASVDVGSMSANCCVVRIYLPTAERTAAARTADRTE